MSRKILVIGGNRFFGRRLVHLLIENGDDVTVFNRGQHGDDFGDRVHRMVGDRKDVATLRRLVHAERWDLVYDQVCFDANEAKEACEIFSGNTKRYIFTSSQAVYNPGQNLKEEDFNPLTHKFTHVADRYKEYGEAKRQCEAVFFAQSKMPVVAVRFPIVMGTDDYTERLKFYVKKVKNQEPFTLPNPQAKLSFVNSEDAARGLFLLGTSDFQGPVNMASQDPLELNTLIREIESVTGEKARIDRGGEASPYGLEKDWYMNVAAALRVGFKPAPISEWLRPLLEFLKST